MLHTTVDKPNLIDYSTYIDTPTDDFNTHRKILKHYLEHTDGNIIEFGVGYGSTPIILDHIKNTNRHLISIENDAEWINKIKTDFPPSDNHSYVLLNDHNEIPLISKVIREKIANISICFIDNKPWDARIIAMNEFKNVAEYIMIHDVDYFPNNNLFGKRLKYPDSPDSFDFSDVCNPMNPDNWQLYYPDKPWPGPTGPPTLVFSCINKNIYKNI